MIPADFERLHLVNLDIDALDDDTLVPFVLHDSSDLVGRLVADEGTDEVQSGVETGGDAATGDDTEATKLKLSSTSVALAAGVALLEGEASLACIAWATTSIWATTDVWVVVFLAQVEAEVVDDVTLLHDVGAFGHVALSGRLAKVLQLDDVVGMGSGAEAGQDTGLSQEEGAGANGQQSAFAGWVLHLDVGVCLDEAEWLKFVLEDDINIASRDDKYVKLAQALVGFFEGDVGAEVDTLSGGDGLFIRGKGALECSALCGVDVSVKWSRAHLYM